MRKNPNASQNGDLLTFLVMMLQNGKFPMNSLLLALIGWGTLVVMLELIMWSLFRRKVAHICFTDDVTHFPYRRFTISWMRLMMLLHMVVLVAVVFLIHLFLWS